MRFLLTIALVLALGAQVPWQHAWATDAPKSNRKKVIDFDDEMVEGLNKRPLDSLSQISERGKKRGGNHLYRKRGSFTSDNRELLSEASSL
jgi:hypothetical protein